MSKSWKNIADEYDDKDWSFSSAFAWGKVVEANPTPYNLVCYSDQLRLSGNGYEALKQLNKIELHEIPNDFKHQYYIVKGMILNDDGKIDEAINAFRNALEAKPVETYPYVVLGTALSKKGKLDEAETVFKQALEKEGDIDEVNYNLGLNYARRGKLNLAIDRMQQCLKIDPNYPNVNTWLMDLKNLKEEMNKMRKI